MTKAINVPLKFGTSVDSGNTEVVGGTRDVSADKTTLAGKSAAGEGGIEGGAASEIALDRMYSPGDIEFERFMNEVLEVYMMDPNSEDEPGFVEITVNGNYVKAIRGDNSFMRRYHVAVLAQAKSLRVTQQKVVAPDGSMSYVDKAVTKLNYPFSVVNDPAGRRGNDWLKAMLKAPV